MLTSVTAAYLQRNLGPQVRSITVHPPGIVFQKPFAPAIPISPASRIRRRRIARSTNAAMNAQQGARDRRRSGAGRIRRACRRSSGGPRTRTRTSCRTRSAIAARAKRPGRCCARDLTDPILVWDTTTVPNGTYFVKVVASDCAVERAATRRCRASWTASAFEIDNTPPADRGQRRRVDDGRTIVTFDVSDDHSPIQRVECSQDGLQWRPVFPTDGIADSAAANTTSWSARRARSAARPEHPRHRRDEQRRDRRRSKPRNSRR